MRIPVSLAALLVLGACAEPVRAQPRPWNRVVLVELFTSQGCSSCPAADALVRELPARGYPRDKVLPLTFHVSYWDGYGWKDPFSSQAFTDRQQWYADSGKLRSPDLHVSARELYTPQMVVNGAVHFSGARRQVALSEIQRAAATPAPVSLTAKAAVDGDVADVTVRVAAGAHLDASATLIVALAAKSARTPVPSGENSGRTLEEADVVRDLSPPLPLPGPAGRMGVRLKRPNNLRWADVEIVAFVQSTISLEVLGATAAVLPDRP
jgi:hypothetical protein